MEADEQTKELEQGEAELPGTYADEKMTESAAKRI